MRVSFYVMAVAAMGASSALTAELKNLNLHDNEELDLAEVGTDGEFIGGMLGSIGGALGIGRRGHH